MPGEETLLRERHPTLSGAGTVSMAYELGFSGSGDTATAPVTDLRAARIRRRNTLGGLIHEYERAA